MKNGGTQKEPVVEDEPQALICRNRRTKATVGASSLQTQLVIAVFGTLMHPIVLIALFGLNEICFIDYI